jgi:hypothetical protein
MDYWISNIGGRYPPIQSRRLGQCKRSQSVTHFATRVSAHSVKVILDRKFAAPYILQLTTDC